MQEVDREDPGGLSVQELPPGRARAARRRADARSPQDLIDGGRPDCDAELGQLAVDPAVAPQRVLFRQPDDKAGDATGRWRAAWLAPFAPCRTFCRPACGARPVASLASREGHRPSARGVPVAPAR
jgi:hypothetical protein